MPSFPGFLIALNAIPPCLGRLPIVKLTVHVLRLPALPNQSTAQEVLHLFAAHAGLSCCLSRYRDTGFGINCLHCRLQKMVSCVIVYLVKILLHCVRVVSCVIVHEYSCTYLS